ncbi:hypothetical protein [Candidatus Phycosocius spiralis]|uniref:WD40 repeat domain-containing protein n=1 Tax=Candidatus Phycosocius spiralis TaxID=2815099 RepID=A0ABQ4PXL7_9PROT|nr:hypothetical protein [Candidatus Phycosocius spiralis]GIU67752.1 hypothetical protein PsB1_1906 [Candidatus Phycosocius spiralis]
MSKRLKGPARHTAPGVGAAWIENKAVFVFGDGLIRLGEKEVYPHQGGILAMTGDPLRNAILTSGDDGKVIRVDGEGDTQVIFDAPRIWLDAIELHPETGRIAVAVGKQVALIELGGEVATLTPPKGPTAFAFNEEGTELAVAHSGGISLFDTRAKELVQEIPCGGGPISVAYSVQNAFLFVGLSEPALAGWRLRDGKAFKMGGYPAKPRQLYVLEDGGIVLTSGGPALLAWPILGDRGPMGQQAGVYRPRLGLVTAVVGIGHQALVGWSDGGVDQVDLFSGQFKHLCGTRPRRELVDDPRKLRRGVISLALHPSGKQFGWVTEDGAHGHLWLT